MSQTDIVSTPTIEYFVGTESIARSVGPIAATLGFRFGMAVALRHPEYAQAYTRMTADSRADAVEDEVVTNFINAVPISMEEEPEDVLPSDQQ